MVLHLADPNSLEDDMGVIVIDIGLSVRDGENKRNVRSELIERCGWVLAFHHAAIILLDVFSNTLETVTEVVFILFVFLLLGLKKWVQKRKRSLKVQMLQADVFWLWEKFVGCLQ